MIHKSPTPPQFANTGMAVHHLWLSIIEITDAPLVACCSLLVALLSCSSTQTISFMGCFEEAYCVLMSAFKIPDR